MDDNIDYGLRDKQVSLIKDIATMTLEELAAVELKIRKLQQLKRCLKMDVDDFKEGRLDRMAERHKKDPGAKEESVVTIERIEEGIDSHISPYHRPYAVMRKNIDGDGKISFPKEEEVWLTCSVARHNVVGAYELSNGDVVHLR